MVDDRLIKTIPLFRVRVLSHVVLSARSIESTEPAIKTVEIVLARTHAPRNRFTCEIRKRLPWWFHRLPIPSTSPLWGGRERVSASGWGDFEIHPPPDA